jgi:aspartate aminotransferase
MISNKMKILVAGDSAIRDMFEEGNRLSKLYGRDNVYDFSLGNPNYPAPDSVRQAIMNEISDGDPVILHGYMPNAGFEDVRKAVADNLNERFKTAFGAGNILMTVGAAGALNVIIKALLNPGDEVLTISPYFLEYGNYVSNCGGTLIPVPARADNFMPDCDAIRAAVTPRTKAVILNNPNNPTGVVYGESEIRELAAVLEERQRAFGNSIYLISDEPYRELCYDGLTVPFLTNYYANTIVGYSWSKSLSLPGERIGYVCVPDACEDHELVFKAACIANRVLGFVNAPSLQQRVVARCLGDYACNLGKYDANRRLLYNGLTGLGYTCIKPQGAFYLWMRTPGEESAFVKAAKRYHILLVGGSGFNCGGYVRIAYCVSPDTIRGSLPGFAALYKEFRK